MGCLVLLLCVCCVCLAVLSAHTVTYRACFCFTTVQQSDDVAGYMQ